MRGSRAILSTSGVTTDMRAAPTATHLTFHAVLNTDEHNQWTELLVEEELHLTDLFFTMQQAIFSSCSACRW